MATKRKAIPNGTKRCPKPETFYQTIFHAYYINAFRSISDDDIKTLLPKITAIMPIDIFLSRAQGKDLYHDPTPRSIRPIINLILAIHANIIESIEIDDAEFIEMMLSMPEVSTCTLKDAPDPKGYIIASFNACVFKSKSKVSAVDAARAMERFIKRLVETVFHMVILGGHLPATKPYLPYLCYAAIMPPPIIQIAKALPPVSRRSAKKGSAAPSVLPEDSAHIDRSSADENTDADCGNEGGNEGGNDDDDDNVDVDEN